ncbi:MAG: hypothetical protein JWP49_72 [Phenylobacterium sp.]|nr:hypothetical protein [Phenylobacterium sp.]
MDRRTLIVTGLVTLGTASLAQAQTESRSLPPAAPRGAAPPPPPPPPPLAEAPPAPNGTPAYPTAPSGKAETFSRDEIVNSVSDFLGVTAESAGAAVERIFVKNGRPTGYIAGTEGSGALGIGARYGKGLLYMKNREPMEVYWQGPSIGFDTGGNASRVFTLCYDLDDPNLIFQRFPGVEGAAYFIAGVGVNYQRAGGITLAPMRAGVGFRLGANVGYLSYSRKRNIIPF